MLNLLKHVLEKYYHLLMKMEIDSTIVTLATSNLVDFYDVQVMFNLACLLFLLTIVIHKWSWHRLNYLLI